MMMTATAMIMERVKVVVTTAVGLTPGKSGMTEQEENQQNV